MGRRGPVISGERSGRQYRHPSRGVDAMARPVEDVLRASEGIPSRGVLNLGDPRTQPEAYLPYILFRRNAISYRIRVHPEISSRVVRFRDLNFRCHTI